MGRPQTTRLPDGESSRVAQAASRAAPWSIAGRHPGATIAAVSHGNLIALVLNAHDPTIGFELWDAMPMPALYEIEVPAGPA